MSDQQVYVSVSVPVRLVGSHGISKPGFDSATKGLLSTAVADPRPGQAQFVHRFSANDMTVLGTKITSFDVADPAEGWQKLNVTFATEHTADAIQQFLQRWADALTVSFAAEQRDPWHGNLVVEVGWGQMRLNPAVVPGATNLHLHDSVSITVNEARPLSTEMLERLADSDLTEIFVEGMRANRPKAKYISWFIIIEEFERLATDAEFQGLFTSLFPKKKEERKAIAKASQLTGKPLERLQTFLGNPNLTVESRAEKLCALLKTIGITEVSALNTNTYIDVDLCQNLIDGRNALAHKGNKVEEHLLYKVLFPLSCRVMDYLNTRDGGLGNPDPAMGVLPSASSVILNGEMPSRTPVIPERDPHEEGPAKA
jgi:hypothetical protein